MLRRAMTVEVSKIPREGRSAESVTGRVHYLVKFGSHGEMIHWWQQMPLGKQGLSRWRLTADGTKLRYWLAGSRDRYLLALGNSIDHLAAMVPQFADRDVSQRRRCITRDTSGTCGSRGRVRADASSSQSGMISCTAGGGVSRGCSNRPREIVASTIATC